jgi:cold shock protein
MKQDRFLIALLVTTLGIAVVASVTMAGRARVVEILMLFFGAFGAGVSFRALMAARHKRRDTKAATPRAERTSTRAPRQRRSRAARPSKATKAERTTGTVKWFDETKGYGFITPENGDKDCFVHRSSVKNGTPLVEGKRVEFEITKDERGRRAAANVMPL